jgi:hypothetical protein
MKSRRKQKPFDPEKEKSIKFAGTLPITDYQKEYFTSYPFGYWLHKALALVHFIEDRSRLSVIRFSKDIDDDEFIIENLKMEIHMMVFHSAESLFLTVLGHYFYPPMPWFWMSVCTQNKFNNIINLWRDEGLDSIINKPEEWLRDMLYPTINENHIGYQKTEQSATFVKRYLDRLLSEYMRHREYAAYKLGMKTFASLAPFGAIDDTSGQEHTVQNENLIEFLVYEPPQHPDIEYRVNLISKKYDVESDIKIIRITTWLLQNIFERKRAESKATAGQKVSFNLALFDTLKIENIFGPEHL